MRIVCQQTILMKYHALFFFWKSGKIFNCRLLQIIGGALRVKPMLLEEDFYGWRLDQMGYEDFSSPGVNIYKLHMYFRFLDQFMWNEAL